MRIGKLYLLACLPVLCLGCGPRNDRPAPSADAQALPPDAADADPNGADPARKPDAVLLFLGNSLSAGAGVDPAHAFPALVQQRMDSLGWNAQAINAGLSGETSAGGLRRIDWYLERHTVDVLVLELGGNDGLRGIPVDVTKRNLRDIVDKARRANPDMEIILAGMQIPPNLGPEYAQAFRNVYPALAAGEQVRLIPFLLEGVGGVDSLMQADGIHPNEAGHRIVAEHVWAALQPVMEKWRFRE